MQASRFLHDEYRMNALIGAYPKPYVALIHGICMGGGAGISVHGRYRLADASLSFAMPETGIGFIPDVGSSYFLSRLPDEIGMYLGLTGLPIGLGDALEAGLMTHAVAREDFDAVIDALAAGRDFAPFIRRPREGPLSFHRGRIATFFSGGSVEAILERLDRDGSDFALATARTIRTRSPTSLKIVFRQLRVRAGTEPASSALRWSSGWRTVFFRPHDFREGVRAALIDKDRNPKWQPHRLQALAIWNLFCAASGRTVLICGENCLRFICHEPTVCSLAKLFAGNRHFTRL